MKNQVFSVNNEVLKVIGFNDDKLMISSKGHNDIESLAASAEKSGMMETIKTVDIPSITSIFFNEKDHNIKVKYTNKKGKEKSHSIELLDHDLTADFANELAEMRGFTKAVSTETTIRPLLYNIAGIVFTGFITWLAYSIATGSMEVSDSGRRRGLQVLFGRIAETLGPIGVIILGSLITLFLAYSAYKRFSNPASVVEYK